MIKSYKELNSCEKNLALEFANRNKEEKLEFKNFESKVYDFGNGVVFYFNNENIVGMGYIVLEVVKFTEVIYIHFIDILNSFDDKEEVLKSIIYFGKKLSKEYKATKLLLGIREEKILRVANNIGLSKSYSSLNMILEDRTLKEKCLELVSLSKENLNEYVEIYNKSFLDMPHGSAITVEDAIEYLDNNNDYFFVCDNGNTMGILNTEIKDNEGFFDIGLCKEYRGKKYGKKLLETAIDNLINKNVEKICLTVIESNRIAYEMYKKRGFKKYTKLSDWIDLSEWI